MMDWLAHHGPNVTLLVFFIGFVGFALWAYAPRNKAKFEDFAQIPLRETDHGE